MSGDWEAQWKNDKKRFEKDSGSKKPSKKFLGVFRLGTGIENSLKHCDGAYQTIVKVRANPKVKIEEVKKALVHFGTTIQAYEKSEGDYVKVLHTSMEKGDEQVKPFVDVLVKELASIGAAMALDLKKGEVAIQAEEQNLTSREKKALKLVSSAKAAVQKALAAAALSKSKGTPQSFNDSIPDAAGDLAKFLADAGNLQQEGFDFVGNPNALLDLIVPWAEGSRQVKPNATKEQVLNEIGVFAQAVGQVKAWVDQQH